MKSVSHRSGRPSTRTRRRAIVLALYSSLALAIGATFAAAPTPARPPAPATRPAAPAAPNPAAAEAEFQKAKTLYDQQKYPEAKAENDKALQLDPSHAQALLLKRVLAGKLAAATPGTVVADATQPGSNVKPGVLTSQQISKIRLLELGSDERNIRGSIDRKTLDDFWNDVIKKDQNLSPADLTQANHDRFVSPANFPAQVMKIRDSANHAYMEKVNITSDPAALIGFKNNVSVFVMSNCATSECHSGDKGGNFRLLTPSTAPAGTSPEQILYTNFYIMSMYVGKDGGNMIDRGSPDQSLFLQYSLPKNVGKYPHPNGELPKKLASLDDPRFSKMVDWIKTLAFPRPNYNIAFDLPTGAPK